MCVKKKIKEYKYTLIFIICIAVSALLCLDMLHNSKTPQSDNITQQNPSIDNGKEYKYTPNGDSGVVVLNETDIEKMVVKELPGDYPLQNIKITIKENGKSYVTGEIDQRGLRTYVAKSGAQLNSYIDMALQLCPEKIKVNGEFDIGTSADGGLLLLTPRKIDAAGVNLPDGTLPQEFFDSLNESVNRALTNSGYLFQSIRIKEGYVELVP